MVTFLVPIKVCTCGRYYVQIKGQLLHVENVLRNTDHEIEEFQPPKDSLETEIDSFAFI